MNEQLKFHLTEEQWAIVEKNKQDELEMQRIWYNSQHANMAYTNELIRTQTKALNLAEVRYMTDLRDRIAMCALATTYAQSEESPDKTARWAYEVADAMMKEREVNP